MKSPLFALALGLLSPHAFGDYNPQRIEFSNRYPTSYADWQDAFLAGNGKMGIMVFGDPLNETVVFNDRGFNLAKTVDRSFAQVSAADLETIKDDCAKGDFAAANKLAGSVPQYKSGGDGSRHPGFAMFIATPADGPVTGYSRTCDFRTGEIIVRWSDARGAWTRKAFVSRQDNVTVQSLTAPANGKISCTIRLAVDPGMDLPKSLIVTQAPTDSCLNFRAKYRANSDVGYEGATRYVVTGGSHHLDGNTLTITDADSVMLLTRTEKYPGQCEAVWNKAELQAGLALLPADYDTLLQGQRATHEAIFDRVAIDLNATATERAKSNEALLDEQKNSVVPVPALWERIFDSGRYFYLSSSNTETPPDLLGIWTANTHAGWGGFYHLDANLNLQISQGNTGDMPEAMAGYFKINESWRTDFETNARKLLGCRGMLAGGNSPGPGAGLMASLNEYYPYQYATGEEAWLLYPFWEHYLVTGDTAFLRDHLYPLLRDMGDFYEDFLTKTDANGHYILAGSVSPENQPSNLHISLVNNSNFDLSGAKFILTTLIQTCNILGLDQGPGQGVEKWTQMLNKLPPYLVNSDGALQEWAWPVLDENFGHRHSSHLLPIWPYREITPETTPTLFNAALVSQSRKDATNITPGHGLVHGALIAAGLKNEQSVRTKLLRLTRNGYFFDSLFTSHAPHRDLYCADVCNTVPAVMMEMLVSSSPGIVELLPALPHDLEKGAIRGIKGRNRVTVENLAWDNSAHTVTCTLQSDIDQSLTLIDRDGIHDLAGADSTSSPLGEIARTLPLKAGIRTQLTFTSGHLRPHKINRALGQPVTASTSADKTQPANVVDDDLATRWASEPRDNQWISVDLGSARDIDEIKLDWETAAGKDYDLEVSDDGQSWRTLQSITGNSASGWLDYPHLNAHGRYVRINGKTRLTQYGFSLWELQVFDRD